MTSRLSITVTSTGAGAKAIFTDVGLVNTPALPVGISDIDATVDAIPAAAISGDSVGVQAYLYDLDVNAVRYRITTQSTAGFFAVNATTGAISIAQAATGLAGQTKTVTVEAIDQVSGATSSETYTFTFTA